MLRSPGGRGSPPGVSYAPPPPPPASGASSTWKGLLREQGGPRPGQPHRRGAPAGLPLMAGGLPGGGWGGLAHCSAVSGTSGTSGRDPDSPGEGLAVRALVLLVRMRIPEPQPAVRLSGSADSTLRKPPAATTTPILGAVKLANAA